MKPLVAFVKKECLEAIRTGKFIMLILLFVLFGIMSPALAKLIPWIMEMQSEAMAEMGLIVTETQVDAMTSWAQFFKNIPIALIAFVLLFSDTFTKEYRSGTLLLVLTKGLSRYKVVFAKTLILLSFWTFGYGLCFAITYGYNAYFWDNSIAKNLFSSAVIWWLFGVWVISFIVLFSSILKNNTEVSLCTGGAVILCYLLGMIPKVKEYLPTMLMDTNSLLTDVEGMDTYIKAIIVAAIIAVICIAVSIPVMNKKHL